MAREGEGRGRRERWGGSGEQEVGKDNTGKFALMPTGSRQRKCSSFCHLEERKHLTPQKSLLLKRLVERLTALDKVSVTKAANTRAGGH